MTNLSRTNKKKVLTLGVADHKVSPYDRHSAKRFPATSHFHSVPDSPLDSVPTFAHLADIATGNNSSNTTDIIDLDNHSWGRRATDPTDYGIAIPALPTDQISYPLLNPIFSPSYHQELQREYSFHNAIDIFNHLDHPSNDISVDPISQQVSSSTSSIHAVPVTSATKSQLETHSENNPIAVSQAEQQFVDFSSNCIVQPVHESSQFSHHQTRSSHSTSSLSTFIDNMSFSSQSSIPMIHESSKSIAGKLVNEWTPEGFSLAESGINYTDPVVERIVRVRKRKQYNDYACIHCDLIFPDLSHFVQHLDSNRLIRYIPPSNLGRNDFIYGAIQADEKAIMATEQVFNIDGNQVSVCGIIGCGRVFKRKDSLHRHERLVHENRNSRFNQKIRMKRIRLLDEDPTGDEAM